MPATNNNKKQNNNKQKNYNKSYNNQNNKKEKKPYIPRSTVKAESKYTCEYRMSSGMAYEILKDTSGDPQKILCDWVNQNCGLLWECVKVTTD